LPDLDIEWRTADVVEVEEGVFDAPNVAALEKKEIEVVGDTLEQSPTRQDLEVVWRLEIGRELVGERLSVGVEADGEGNHLQELEKLVSRIDRIPWRFLGGESETIGREVFPELSESGNGIVAELATDAVLACKGWDCIRAGTTYEDQQTTECG
jgi:hypothetical protein